MWTKFITINQVTINQVNNSLKNGINKNTAPNGFYRYQSNYLCPLQRRIIKQTLKNDSSRFNHTCHFSTRCTTSMNHLQIQRASYCTLGSDGSQKPNSSSQSSTSSPNSAQSQSQSQSSTNTGSTSSSSGKKQSFREWIRGQVHKFENQRGTTASTSAVKLALCGNILNTLGKSVVFWFTGSVTLLSETLHSMADVVNQSLLYIGVRRSQRPPTQEYPYGFEGERFVYALISATGIFFMGACFSVYNGIQQIINPGELNDLYLGLVILSFSGLIELVSFTRGVLSVKAGARESGMKFLEYIRRGRDPMGVTVVLEDGAALVGLGIATGCLGLSYWTGQPFYDGVGSIIIGLGLGGIAIFLIQKNVSSLSTRSVPVETRNRIIDMLKSDPVVDSVHQIIVVQLGAETISMSAEIEYKGDEVARKYLSTHPDIIEDFIKNGNNPDAIKSLLIDFGNNVVKSLGDEVDRIEKDIRTAVPEVKYVDLESN